MGTSRCTVVAGFARGLCISVGISRISSPGCVIRVKHEDSVALPAIFGEPSRVDVYRQLDFAEPLAGRIACPGA